jgi:hypothetical protein
MAAWGADDVLVAMAFSDARAAIDQWRRLQWPTLADPALQEVGTAVLWVPDASGPNSRYIWVAVMARPLLHHSVGHDLVLPNAMP